MHKKWKNKWSKWSKNNLVLSVVTRTACISHDIMLPVISFEGFELVLSPSGGLFFGDKLGGEDTSSDREGL